MTFNSIGDLANSVVLSQASAKAKHHLARLSKELTTGLTSETRNILRNDLSIQIDWEHGLSKNSVLDKTLTEALTKVQAKQAAVNVINETAMSFSNDVSVTVSSNTITALNTLSLVAKSRLSQTLSHLNTQALGQSLFAGSATDKSAVAPADEIIASVKAYVGSSSSVDDVIAGVRNWMDDPVNGYSSVAYLGANDPSSPIRLSNDRFIDETSKANDPAIKRVVESYILATLSADTGPLSERTQQTLLLQNASEQLRSAGDGLVELQASLGFTEAEISSAKVSNKAESHAYEIMRLEILGVDEFETANKLKNTELQLEKIYALTARTARLSLLEYLR